MKKKQPVQTTFGELTAGDFFCLALSHFDYGLKYVNVKMHGFGVFRGMDGKTVTEFEDYPFNVVTLGEGRPRTFRDDEKVYKVEKPEKS